MKVFYPSDEEMSKLSLPQYIEHLVREHQAEQYGVIKIVPPASFKPQMVFDMNQPTKMNTRF